MGTRIQVKKGKVKLGPGMISGFESYSCEQCICNREE